MNRELRRLAIRVGRPLQRAGNALLTWLIIGILRAVRLIDRRKLARVTGALFRKIGPRLPEHRTGRANLVAAFPEKSAEEIERILIGVWDNLGRVVAEFAHIDRMHIEEPYLPRRPDIVYAPYMLDRYHEIRYDNKPALFFAAHVANWELPARVAFDYGLKATVLFRPPNITAASDAITRIRAGAMCDLLPTSLDAPVKLARILAEGGHVGMLVDQHYVKGVDVKFFGRMCKANPLLAMLARQVEAPIFGVRMIRLPDDTFRGEITEEIAPARDAEGKVDVQGTMQVVTSVVESWVREYPEQWLWLHRRWR
jgi:KDO2-lipid IV(A) lauroyltransferase